MELVVKVSNFYDVFLFFGLFFAVVTLKQFYILVWSIDIYAIETERFCFCSVDLFSCFSIWLFAFV